MDRMFQALGLYAKCLEDCSRKAEFAVDNIWHHLKVSPSLLNAAAGRLTQGARVLTEGGHERVFYQNFGKYEGERLIKCFACYLCNSFGPINGTLYISSTRLAFCSDLTFPHYSSPTQPHAFFYKVVVEVEEMAAVNPSSNTYNPTEKYIQVVRRDGQQLWFTGFVSYDKALHCLTHVSLGPYDLIR